MDKALTFCRIGLLLLLSAAGVISQPGGNIVDQTIAAAVKITYAASVYADIADEQVPLSDMEELIIDDTTVPLSGSYSGFAEFSAKLIELVNIERGKAGLSILTVSDLLITVAEVRAAELEEQYSHTRPDGRDWVTIRSDFNIPGRGAGENLNKNTATPESCMQSWINSPDHKANILMPEWNKVGVGIHEGSDGTLYWAMVFTD